MQDVTFILWLQQFSNSFWDSFFSIITTIGNAEYYMITIPIFYWCYNKRFTFKFALFIIATTYVNSTIKAIANVPRPSADEVRVLAAYSAPGNAFPSGHTQGTLSFWGYMSLQVKKTWFTICSVILIFLVALSRMYLGLHYLTDIVGGIFFGLVVLVLFNLYYERISKKIVVLSKRTKLLLSILVPPLFLLSKGHDNSMLVGFSMGLLVGYQLESEKIGFNPKGALWQHVAKVALGIAVFFGLRVGLKAILVPIIPFDMLADVIRYGIIGLWAAYFAPLLFRKLGLEGKTIIDTKVSI